MLVKAFYLILMTKKQNFLRHYDECFVLLQEEVQWIKAISCTNLTQK